MAKIKPAPRSVPQSIGSYIQYGKSPKKKAAAPIIGSQALTGGTFAGGITTTDGYLSDPNAPPAVGEIDPTTGLPVTSTPQAPALPTDPTTGEPTFVDPSTIPTLVFNPETGEYGTWETPDAETLITRQAAGDIETARNTEKAKIRALLYRYGWDPAHAGEWAGSDLITQADIQNAATNPFSVLNRANAYQQGIQSAGEASIGARGLYGGPGGETHGGMGGAWTGVQDVAQKAWDARMANEYSPLLGDLGGAASDYAGAATEARRAAVNFLSGVGAFNRVWRPYGK